MINKNFKEEFYKFLTKFKSRENFSFSKYADGEWSIINGIDISIRGNEWKYQSKNDEFIRNKLIESFKFKDKNYFVGISCSCCQGIEHKKMLDFSEQNIENLTFANIFVNSNYSLYKELFIDEFKKRDIFLVANRRSNINSLPFKIEKWYKIDDSAFNVNYSLIEEIKQEKNKNKVFLFCAGPFGNILAHELWKDNKQNTYLDIGSTLNPWLGNEGNPRDYYLNKDSEFKNRTCIWG